MSTRKPGGDNTKNIVPIYVLSDLKRITKYPNSEYISLLCEYYRAALAGKDNSAIQIGDNRLYYGDLAKCLFMLRETWFFKYYDIGMTDKSPVVYDLGANIGVPLLYFKTTYPDAKVYCYEPQKTAYNILSKNVHDNRFRDTYAYNLAVSDHNGLIGFMEGDGGQSLLGHIDEESKEKVSCVRLSDRIRSDVDLLKMDIEGAEKDVLKDLQTNDKLRYVKNIVMEYHYNSLSLDELKSIAKDGHYNLSIDSYGISECRAILRASG